MYMQITSIGTDINASTIVSIALLEIDRVKDKVVNNNLLLNHSVNLTIFINYS